LADETQVWATGRTVQCGGCGQRWRAFGGGVDPRALGHGGLEASVKPPAETPAPSPLPVPTPATLTADMLEESSTEPEVAPLPAFQPLEPIAPRGPAVAEEPLAAPALFRTPPRRAARTSRYGPPGLGAALAILFLIFLAAAVAILYRDLVVRKIPALASVYRAVGLPPAASETIPSGPALPDD
jgi:hypothetical protein